MRQTSHKMKNNNSKWVLGHKITPVEVSGDYDFVIGETPAKIPGPPPHMHKGYKELFLVIEGEMDFVVDGIAKTIKQGESVDIVPGVVHTFGNNCDVACKWINVHSPKGFLSFFNDLGIPVDEKDAQAKSIKKAVIERVMQEAVNYDMHIKI